MSQALSLGAGTKSSTFLPLSTKYKSKFKINKIAAIYVELIPEMYPKNTGIVRNDAIIAVSSQEIFLKLEADPTVIKTRGRAKL
ncbi:MAG: hypothetical protein O2U62_03335 [Candidatus Bathyarchaeota archaeon]|nr:hypothetical protein [Candidatus Bathyarchaeota archaeon]